LISALIGAAGLGVLLGLSLRVPAVVAACAAIALAGIVIAPFADVGAITAALTTLGSIVALQCGFLGGLALSCVWSRVRSSSLLVRGSTLGVDRWADDRQSSRAG
jgi:hypothetical protein